MELMERIQRRSPGPCGSSPHPAPASSRDRPCTSTAAAQPRIPNQERNFRCHRHHGDRPRLADGVDVVRTCGHPQPGRRPGDDLVLRRPAEGSGGVRAPAPERQRLRLHPGSGDAVRVRSQPPRDLRAGAAFGGGVDTNVSGAYFTIAGRFLVTLKWVPRQHLQLSTKTNCSAASADMQGCRGSQPEGLARECPLEALVARAPGRNRPLAPTAAVAGAAEVGPPGMEPPPPPGSPQPVGPPGMDPPAPPGPPAGGSTGDGAIAAARAAAAVGPPGIDPPTPLGPPVPAVHRSRCRHRVVSVLGVVDGGVVLVDRRRGVALIAGTTRGEQRSRCQCGAHAHDADYRRNRGLVLPFRAGLTLEHRQVGRRSVASLVIASSSFPLTPPS